MNALPPKTTSLAVRAHLVDTFRRDLVGPSPHDTDLARERLNENPSRWYLTGFLAPADDPLVLDAPGAEAAEADPSVQEEMEIEADGPETDGAGGAATDAEAPDAPNARRRFLALVRRPHRPAFSRCDGGRGARHLGRLPHRAAPAREHTDGRGGARRDR